MMYVTAKVWIGCGGQKEVVPGIVLLFCMDIYFFLMCEKLIKICETSGAECL